MPIRSQFKTDSEYRDALRDWFAGQALAGILAAPFEFADVMQSKAPDRPTARCDLAYTHADAMMETRNA
jgi:hypothetical protein